MSTKPDLPIADAPVPATHTAKSRERQIKRSATGNAAQAIGILEPGCEHFIFTNGQFSLIDILEYCLEQTGPATIDLATWTAADGDLRKAHAFMLNGSVTRLRMIVDPSFRVRKPNFCKTLVDLFGNDAIRTTPLHGKFACIRGANLNLAIRSSMNLNPNRRIETCEISDDEALAGFLTDFTDKCFERSAAANFASQSFEQNAAHDVETELDADAGGKLAF